MNRRKRTSGGRNGTSSGGKAKKKAGSGHNRTEGADVTNLKPTLLTLPWSTMEKIYTYEREFSVRDVPSRDEMDQQLRRFAKERHDAPGMYHLYLVSDWWRTKLRANKGTRWLKQGNWRQLIYKSTCEDRSLPPGSEPDDHCAIHAIEGLVFARETYTSENGEIVHVVSQVDDADGEVMVGDLLIGQFRAYRTGLPGTQAPANAVIYNTSKVYQIGLEAYLEQRTAVYKIGLEEVAECLIECTQERHRRRLALQTKKAQMKMNATATQVNTYRQPGAHVQKGASFRFEAERKELTRLTEENGPTTQRLHQSVTDEHSELMGGDTVIQVMGGRCLEVLNNMREIRADQHEYLGETDLATTLTRRGLSEEIAIHKYEFKRDRERKKRIIEVRQVETSESTVDKSDACVKGLLVIVHMAGADAHCVLVKSDVHKSRGDWWNKYAEKVAEELTNEVH